eukprot:scaffold47199_cov26-Cyclotella_meneghiniana.AAC.1
MEQRKRCDGIDLPIVPFPSVTPAATMDSNIESEFIPSQAQAGCTSVNLENPIDCCISYDNSAAFLFDFLSSNPPINLEPFNILLSDEGTIRLVNCFIGWNPKNPLIRAKVRLFKGIGRDCPVRSMNLRDLIEL